MVGRNAFPSAPIPHFDSVVKTATDKLGIVKLKAADAAGVVSERSELFSSVNVPNLDCSIVGSAGKDMVIEL